VVRKKWTVEENRRLVAFVSERPAARGWVKEIDEAAFGGRSRRAIEQHHAAVKALDWSLGAEGEKAIQEAVIAAGGEEEVDWSS
jgi:hypothetical protein